MQLEFGRFLQNGKYQILKTLGQGGFGITYEAEQVILRRKVAIKEFFMKDCCDRSEDLSMVVPTQSNLAIVEKFRAKFIREAQMIASFDNPHIVSIFDIFEENGTAYYVMELLTGGSLSDLVKQNGPLPEDTALKYTMQVAEALEHIHSHNTVHLDIKPSNVLLNSKCEAVLIDFGISKHYDDSGEQTSTTPVGISKGYAPLEQYRDGDVSQFKPSTDIYSLGATLYFLVTGQVPPEASIVNEDGLDRVSAISDKVWNAINAAMQPRRKDRPQSIDAFLAFITPNNTEASMTDNVDKEETIIINKQSGSFNNHNWIDLGLPSGIKWAAYNIGASKPESAGELYAWGENCSKVDYDWKNYSFCEKTGFLGTAKRLSKYNNLPKLGYPPDCLLCLEAVDDIATLKWGNNWRMPTQKDVKELLEHCSYKWTSMNGVFGIKFTSKKNNNNIFFPAYGSSNYRFADVCNYWSSSLDGEDPLSAFILNATISGANIVKGFRYVGMNVRAVFDPK